VTAAKMIAVTILIFFLLFSAVAVVYSKYRSRQIFSEIQRMEKQLDQLEVDWGRLQLELTMLTQENRVENEAQDRLKLILPERGNIIYLQP
jgi:cell division protein FtsL